LSRDRFADLIAWAETEYDQIIIDSPPILAASDAAIMGRFVDGLLVVVQPQKNHRRGVIRAFESIATIQPTVLGLVVNAVSHDESSGSDSYGGYGGFGYGYGYGYGYGTNERDVALEPISGTPDAAEVVPQISVAESAVSDKEVHIFRIDEEPAADESIAVRRIADGPDTVTYRSKVSNEHESAGRASAEHESAEHENDITQADTIVVEPSSTIYFRGRAA
jgi:Mrp family chromosome partitioning ATPase